ncbi:hypothetical protein HMI56_006704 [Coelomomyces lativittatus]|nr:hypothetical protein HMI56_006704 [Coelomomyces lativittatus]
MMKLLFGTLFCVLIWCFQVPISVSSNPQPRNGIRSLFDQLVINKVTFRALSRDDQIMNLLSLTSPSFLISSNPNGNIFIPESVYCIGQGFNKFPDDEDFTNYDPLLFFICNGSGCLKTMRIVYLENAIEGIQSMTDFNQLRLRLRINCGTLPENPNEVEWDYYFLFNVPEENQGALLVTDDSSAVSTFRVVQIEESGVAEETWFGHVLKSQGAGEIEELSLVPIVLSENCFSESTEAQFNDDDGNADEDEELENVRTSFLNLFFTNTNILDDNGSVRLSPRNSGSTLVDDKADATMKTQLLIDFVSMNNVYLDHTTMTKSIPTRIRSQLQLRMAEEYFIKFLHYQEK